MLIFVVLHFWVGVVVVGLGIQGGIGDIVYVCCEYMTLEDMLCSCSIFLVL